MVAPWRNAYASVALARALDAKWPGRIRPDGNIGDAAHATRNSDHNPWIKVGKVGVVRAKDVGVVGIDAAWLAEKLRQMGAAGDSRLINGGYVIYNGRITTQDWKGWKRYTGSNPHKHHVHVSFSQQKNGFDNKAEWFLDGGSAAPKPSNSQPVSTGGGKRAPSPLPLVRRGFDNGGYDFLVQECVGVKQDGDIGEETEKAIKRVQKGAGLGADGLVGKWTWILFVQRAGDLKQGAKGHSGIKVLQNLLGFRGAECDGDFGPATTERVREVQRWAGLTADGVVGSDTRKALTRW